MRSGSYDYVSAFLTHPFPASLLMLFLLAMMRLAPIVVLAPFYGGRTLPNPIKMGLIVALALVFFPQLLYLTPEPLNFNFAFIFLAIKELFIGLILGFLVTIPFSIASMAGIWIDHQRGVSSFIFLDPNLQAPVSPLGRLYTNIMIVNFFLLHGDYYFFEGLSRSYQILPPAHLMNPLFFGPENPGFWNLMIRLLSECVGASVQLAAPALVAMFMSDLFLGVANRLAQQVPMSFLGWALKSLLGIGIVWAGWTFLAQRLNVIDFDWLKIIHQIVRTFSI